MNITTNQNNAFLITNEVGDIVPVSEQGFYDLDTRYLNKYKLLISGKKPKKLTGRPVNYYSAVHYLTNPALGQTREGTIAIARNQLVGDGFHEDIDITNYNSCTVNLTLTISADTDFADIFEVKARQYRKRLLIEKIIERNNKTTRFVHSVKDFYRETKIEFTKEPSKISKEGVSWNITLKPKQSWHVCCDILALTKPNKKIEPVFKCGQLGLVKTDEEEGFEDWEQGLTKIETDYLPLKQSYDQSIADLAALRLVGIEESDVPAAGIPWFMTYFGRDSLITALQTLLIAPSVAQGVIKTLARFQGRKVNNITEEEPGKILHEVRFGRLAKQGKRAYSIYYGSIDATLLFVILLHNYFVYTADIEFLKSYESSLIAALNWLDNYGDQDGDGYLEYKRKNKDGLFNQSWKDSFDAIAFADGTIPDPPIATCEIQGYAYDAKIKSSYLFEALGNNKLANKLREEAKKLKYQFNKDFWIEEEQFFALALDSKKQVVNSLASNAGHLLWSKIVDKKRAKLIADRLLSDEFFSGWGIRTLAKKTRSYNPISYHNGSVWPHDNSLIVAGLFNYGLTKQAKKIFKGIVEASSYFSYTRLPELFCGFDRRSSLVPIEYPTSNSPQAWASASIPFMLSTILGIKIGGKNQVVMNPVLLPEMRYLNIKGLNLLGKKIDLLIERTNGITNSKIIGKNELDITIL